MNWPLIILVFIIVIAMIVFLIFKNKKDKKEFEDKLNTDYNKPKHELGEDAL